MTANKIHCTLWLKTFPNFNLSLYNRKCYTDWQDSYRMNNIKMYTSISGEIFSTYRSCNFTFSPMALFKTKSRVKLRSSFESRSMTLKLLRTCDMVDFNSSIANLWPENGKDMCGCFGFKFDMNWNCRRITLWEGNVNYLKSSIT